MIEPRPSAVGVLLIFFGLAFVRIPTDEGSPPA
jgi:hypothetical protein